MWVPKNTTNLFYTVSMPIQHQNVVLATETTNNYNEQLINHLTKFNDLRTTYNQELSQFLDGNGIRNANTYRQRGVSMAWKYEKADIEMGGRGSENWDKQEQQQILDKGRVQGAEGHHQQNVADHPTEQSNPDNIKFFRTREQHLEEGHGGDFHNESDAPMSDKDQMLKDTNTRRVIGNELKGTGIAAAIAFVAAFSISFIVAAAQDGITPEAFKNASINGGNGAIIGAAGFAVGRIVANHITPAIVHALEKVGINVTENLSNACTMGITGIAIVAVVSIVQFIHLKRKGYTTKKALLQVAKSASLSLLTIFATSLICAKFGSMVASYVGIAISVGFIIYSIYKYYRNKKISIKINDLTIDSLYDKSRFENYTYI